MTTLVLTVIGNDRAGLVDALAGPITSCGGSWERSHMARLAGQFAGIVVVSVPDESVAELTSAFQEITARGTLDIQVAIAGPDEPADSTAGAPEGAFQTLHLVGQDRPGIVREIARTLATLDVSIEELVTATASAPMSAEILFEATATLRLPADMSLDVLRDALENIANELMVDLDFGPR